MTETPFARGLEGVVAAKSVLSMVDGQAGRLTYVGYPIEVLAEHSTFEEVCFLLWNKRLPKAANLSTLDNYLRANRALAPGVTDILRKFPKVANAMDALRTAASALSLFDAQANVNTRDANLAKSVRMTAQFATLVAAFHRLRQGQEPVAPRDDLNHAGNFLYMLSGKAPDDLATRIMDVALILHAEHGMNASTFATLVTVSTLSDLYSAVVSGIGALKGPLHGGANEDVVHMLMEIGALDRVDAWVAKATADKRKISGFGHRVYKTYDPRCAVLKQYAERLSMQKNDMTFYQMGNKIEKILIEKLGQKGVYPNVDFYSGIVYHHLGIPVDLFTPIFAVARVAGWTARALEYLEDNRLFRPLDLYVGPEHQEYTPIAQR
ncbi:MAG: citrate/2-methylcitrate synthase [bacterium]